jgi:hypothetical protein
MDAYWTIVIAALAGAMIAGEAFALRSGRTTFSRDAWISRRPFLVGRRARLLLTERKIAMSFVKNWKTGLSGAALILGALADLTALGSGLGLIFAKDGNVTGGTVKQ